MKHLIAPLSLLILLFAPIMMPAQSRSPQYEEYIEKYVNLAQEHQKRYKIPASITLAQGLLESAAGSSELSRKANNHFGIKCHEWNGKTIRYKGDCYRKYKRVEDSYQDHSEFLSRSRYESLYRLKLTDYKGWARGLKKCGYATDPRYAEKLIRIIELYDLNRYVKGVKGYKKKKEEKDDIELIAESREATPDDIYRHTIYRAWGLPYTIACAGDTYQLIATEWELDAKQLAKNNDSDTRAILADGDIVYLEKKHKKALEGYDTHTVADGETLYTISQKYGIQLKHLARRNKLRRDAILYTGQALKLR